MQSVRPELATLNELSPESENYRASWDSIATRVLNDSMQAEISPRQILATAKLEHITISQEKI